MLLGFGGALVDASSSAQAPHSPPTGAAGAAGAFFGKAARPPSGLRVLAGLAPAVEADWKGLAAAMRAFYQQLFRSGGALVERAELVASLALRRRALQRTAQTVAATHRHIHQVVSRQGSGYTDLSTILLHTPDEVDTLLDVAAPA